MKYLSLILLATVLSLTSCRSYKYRNINYLQAKYLQNTKLPGLNIFRPRKPANGNDVLIFIHGAEAKVNTKETYGYLGRNFAKKNVISIIPDYTLSPASNYKNAVEQVAQTIQWAKENIADYGGNPDRIFIMGYATGAHIAALASMKPEHTNDYVLQGLILNEATGLNIKDYLKDYAASEKNEYFAAWDQDTVAQTEASPVNYIGEKTPPTKIYVGTKTNPAIFKDNEQFMIKLQEVQPEAQLDLLDKKHGAMMAQYLWPWSQRYKEIVSFMKKQ